MLNQGSGITNVKSGKIKKMGFKLSVKCDESEPVIHQTCNTQSTTRFFSRHRLGALIQKNFLHMFRNVGYNFYYYFFFPFSFSVTFWVAINSIPNWILLFGSLFLFVFLLPANQVILSCLSLGGDLTSLKLAIVNDELDPTQDRVCNYTTSCTYSMFSCRYLRFIDNTTIIQVQHFLDYLWP